MFTNYKNTEVLNNPQLPSKEIVEATLDKGNENPVKLEDLDIKGWTSETFCLNLKFDKKYHNVKTIKMERHDFWTIWGYLLSIMDNNRLFDDIKFLIHKARTNTGSYPYLMIDGTEIIEDNDQKPGIATMEYQKK